MLTRDPPLTDDCSEKLIILFGWEVSVLLKPLGNCMKVETFEINHMGFSSDKFDEIFLFLTVVCYEISDDNSWKNVDLNGISW